MRDRLLLPARAVLVLAVALTAVALAVASPAYAATTTSNVGYITDFGTGSNDTSGPGSGSSIWVNALTGSPPNGTYTTADGTKTIHVTDVPVSTIDANGESALTAFDTLILYEVCDIGAHPNTVSALNTFVTNGGKLVIYDADRCYSSGAGAADYSSFLFPFTTSNPGPQGASGSYTTVVPSTLTAGLSEGPQPGDAVGDANIFTSVSGAWCASITATNTLGANGFVEATARAPSGGLVIYEGEDNWFTDGPSVVGTHLRLVFDDIMEQNWAPDALPCTIPASGISLSPASQTETVGGTATLTATVVDMGGNPIPGVKVTFTIGSGPNAGKTSSATTDSSGKAAFAYSSSTGGADVTTASFIDSSGVTHTSNAANVVWESIASSATSTPTPPPAVKTAKVVRGYASFAGVGAVCVRHSFTVHVRGSQISSVKFTLGGRPLHTATVHRGKDYAAHISVAPGAHTLTVSVKFRAASKTHPRTFHSTVVGCAAAAPKFTG